MTYASVSVKFPTELDAEIERFLDETGVYTNKSEFIKEACRAHLRELNDDTAIAALRLEQLLARAEASGEADDDLATELEALAAAVDADDLERAVEDAREETATRMYGRDA